jgi:hypothetical protein
MYVDQDEYQKLLSYKEHADKVAIKELTLLKELQGL